MSTAAHDIRVGIRPRAGGATTTPKTGSGLGSRALPHMTPNGRWPPLSGGGAVVQQGPLRRSARGWRPSTECLTNIAHVTRELANCESELGQGEDDTQPEKVGGGRELGDLTTLDYTHWLRGDELCPRTHGEAMLLPHAQKVREAEISEFNSHIANGTFGPPLHEQDYAAGPLLIRLYGSTAGRRRTQVGLKRELSCKGF